MTLIDRLWLGTVQLGLQYGLAVRAPEESEAFALLDAAWALGIRRFDTARAYGRSEERIGRWMAARRRTPALASKLPSLETIPDRELGAAVDRAIEESRKALGCETVDHMLCHRAADLSRPAVRDGLERAQAAGRIGAIGVSAYTPDEALAAIKDLPRIGLAQLPASVLDTRALAETPRRALGEHGGRLMARSLYLQGALLLPPERLPTHLAALAPALRRLRGTAGEAGIPVACLVLAYVLDRAPDAEAVVGFQSATEIEVLGDLPGNLDPLHAALRAMDGLDAGLPPELLDPRTWPTDAK